MDQLPGQTRIFAGASHEETHEPDNWAMLAASEPFIAVFTGCRGGFSKKWIIFCQIFFIRPIDPLRQPGIDCWERSRFET